MENGKTVLNLVIEAIIRVFMDNPLMGIANIAFIIVMILASFVLFGLIFKEKDESIGKGILNGIGCFIAVPIAIIIVIFLIYNIIQHFAEIIHCLITCLVWAGIIILIIGLIYGLIKLIQYIKDKYYY